MSLNDLVTLTNTQEDYLDGALQKDCTTHWVPSPYPRRYEIPELSWQFNTPEYLINHRLSPKPSFTGGSISFESLKLRAVCHYLLDLLPEEGLDEIKESLEEAIKFYLTKPKNKSASLLSPSFEISLGETYERPVFQIAED